MADINNNNNSNNNNNNNNNNNTINNNNNGENQLDVDVSWNRTSSRYSFRGREKKKKNLIKKLIN